MSTGLSTGRESESTRIPERTSGSLKVGIGVPRASIVEETAMAGN